MNRYKCPACGRNQFSCDYIKEHMCSVRDYGANQYKDPCYHCCFGCKHAVEMDCLFVCNKVAEYYHPEEGEVEP